MAVLGQLPNLKRILGLAFGANFLHEKRYDIETLYDITTLSIDKVSMSYLFSISRKFLFRQLITS